MKQKTALITGITGQDGSYLADLLVAKNYQVTGVIRRASTETTRRIQHLINANKIELISGDLTDQVSVTNVVRKVMPDEVYNLAAQSFVPESWSQPILTADVTALGVIRMLEALRLECPKARFYQASSSEMFGKVVESPQSETTPFYPRSPYGVSKLFGHWVAVNYRESYNMFSVSGILFNHESPRRGDNFITQKVVKTVARIVVTNNHSIKLRLGNLHSRRDWGYAPDYVKAMWQMLQADAPEDYVIATGKTHSCETLCKTAFGIAGIDNWKDYVELDESLLRPAEVDLLIGDASKARKQLSWQPSIPFNEMLRIMLDDAINSYKHDEYIQAIFDEYNEKGNNRVEKRESK